MTHEMQYENDKVNCQILFDNMELLNFIEGQFAQKAISIS